MNIENKSVNELMGLLLNKDISNKDKIKINKKLKKCLAYNNIYYSENVKSLNNYFSRKKDKLDDYLYDVEIPDYVKKYIIEYFYDTSYIINLLGKDNISNDLKKFIINKKLNGNNVISVLKNNQISDEIKKLCINKHINNLNIISIIFDRESNSDCIDYILSNNERLFKIALFTTSKKKLIYGLTFEYNLYDSEKIIKKYRPKIYNNLSNALDEKYIKAAYSNKVVNTSLLNKVMDSKEKVLKIINDIKDKEAIEWLEISNLPSEYADIIISNNIDYLNKYIDDMKIDTIFNKLNLSSPLNIKFKDLMLNRKKDELINLSTNLYLYFIGQCYYNDSILENVNKISDEDIVYCLNGIYGERLFDFILKYRNDFLINIIDNINWDNVLNGKINNNKYLNIFLSFPSYVQDKVYEINKEYIMDILKKYEEKVLFDFLNYNKNYNYKINGFINNIKTFIIMLYDYNADNLVYYKTLFKYNINENILDTFSKIEMFLNSNNISLKSFFQYSGYDFVNIVNSILDIINNNKLNDFIIVKDYILNSFNIADSGPVAVTNLNKLIIKYSVYEDLLLDIAKNNINLKVSDKNNLRLLLSTNEFGTINSLFELEEKARNKLIEYKNIILNNDININEIKRMFFDNIIGFDNSVFDNIGDIASLRIFQNDNKNNMELYYLIEEVINSMDLINKIVIMNDKEELIRIVISYIDREDTLINREINELTNIDDRIRRLYELDSMYNLTILDSAREIEGIYNEEYMKLYGGEVFDFRDKNYVLYAHIKSNNERIEDLVNGVSTGNSNFISFSPISYKGQKYYYNGCDCIFAYDRILDNSFICSSLVNMGSNAYIKRDSALVEDIKRNQRGILETSSVSIQNAESLFYREGLKPCGIILVNGKRPNNIELNCHNKYNLPFIITQSANTMIENVKMVFESNKGKYVSSEDIEKVNNIKKYIDSNLVIKKENDIYTGREIAIFTDVHAMYEPIIAILEDIRYRGINEIYSLGDNTSVGPNPREVLDLLDKYNVKQIMGNDEYYLTLGSEPFIYFDEERERSLAWTYDKVNNYINNLKLYKPSLDIILGDKKVALCHFANDIRWDYVKHNTFTYQNNFGNSSNQFMYTNSDKYKEEIEYMINKYGIDNPKVRGYLSSKNDPLFDGKIITSYDDVFEGHVHFELSDKLYNTNIHTLRGAGMGEENNSKKDKAYYLVLKEKKDGNFDIERVYVPFNKNNLLSNVYASDMPSKSKILGYLK